MKRITLIFSLLLTTILLFSQTQEVKIYNPEADARADIAAAVQKAKAENKQVLLQIGGNWCPWCIRLDAMMAQDQEIDSLIKADYVRVMVNYSKENKNDDVMQSLDNPTRFGFPVLVILDQEGHRIHTQDTWYLEQDKAYNREKLVHFLKMWNVKVVKG
jgi:uncharacterized protein YyaL (SSP411 family)